MTGLCASVSSLVLYLDHLLACFAALADEQADFSKRTTTYVEGEKRLSLAPCMLHITVFAILLCLSADARFVP